ncbi:MAG: FMN-dependent L-lactate dehydrogenase LldD [Sphingopyxis sp.]|nr:FMN-dependent L-lactate dehydrogenase LldD [Sphingopyxis sp.]
MKPASIGDYREAARRRLPHFLFEYFDGGSYAERTLRANIEDLQDISLRQRVLNNVSAIDLSTKLLGQDMAMPVALGPIGLAGMAARRGEVQAARAAAEKGVPFTLSTVSACSLAEVAQASSTPFWFQLYMVRDRGFLRALLDEARAARCPVLVFTVDMPLPGARYRDVRSGLSGAANLRGKARRVGQAMRRPGWAWDVGVNGRPHQLGNVAPLLGPKSGLEDFLGWMKDNFDASVTWADLDFIRAHWNGPIVIKGILDADDARRAVEAGVDGIIVSNHGGRQLDGVPSVARALPRIADAVGDRLTLFADGGIRSGLDVVRMLALGAQGVMLGRAWAFALAAAGEAGVRHVLDLIEAEMRVAMALTGATNISGIGPETLAA